MDYLVPPDVSEEINFNVKRLGEGIRRMKITPLCVLCGVCGNFNY